MPQMQHAESRAIRIGRHLAGSNIHAGSGREDRGSTGWNRDLDAAETMPFAQLDALAEPVIRTDPAADVFSITEATERHRLKFGGPGRSRHFQRNAVFSWADLDVTAWKA
jgi:hypothetical protein